MEDKCTYFSCTYHICQVLLVPEQKWNLTCNMSDYLLSMVICIS